MEEMQGFDLQLLDASEVLIAETVGRPALFVDQDEEPSDHAPVAAMPLSVRADSEADLFLNLTDDDGHASAAAAAAEAQQPGQVTRSDLSSAGETESEGVLEPLQPVQPPNDIQETDADTEADPSGPGPAEAAPEAVSIDCLLSLPAKVGVGKGVKRSNKMIEKDSKRDFIYVGDSTDEEDSKPKARGKAKREVAALLRSSSEGVGGKGRSRRGSTGSSSSCGGGGGGGAMGAMRALPMRRCHSAHEAHCRAMRTRLPNATQMLQDPLAMPSIRLMIAQLPPRYVWEAPKSACTRPPVSLEDQLETYKFEGYACMTHDTNRNVRFQAAIKGATDEFKCRKWLEVGPGADAVLTLMVLHSQRDTSVTAVEVNDKAVTKARLHLKTAGLAPRARILSGLSTNTHVASLANAFGPFDAIVHELIGLLAGSEGAAYLLQQLKIDYHLSGSAVQVPCAAATFFCPVLLTPKQLNAERELYNVKDFFCLVKRLQIGDAQRATGGQGNEWLKAGVVEFIDFTSDENLATYQERTTAFRSPEKDAYVNALACWIWCETAPEGAPPRSNQTAYPYGASSQHAPPRFPGSVAFSSLVDDGSACASNWRNLILPFDRTYHIEAGDHLRVYTMADLRESTPSYKFYANVNQWVLCDRHIHNFVPTFTQLEHTVKTDQAEQVEKAKLASKRSKRK